MSNALVPYYNKSTAEVSSFTDYMRNLTVSTNNQIERSTNKQITANALFAGQIDSTLRNGFSDVSRQLGYMNSTMNMGFTFLNSAVQESSNAICDKLDDIHETLEKPLYTQAKESYDRALKNYNDGFYDNALEDLQEAIQKAKTDRPLSYFIYFLMGQTYLRGINEDGSSVIDLNKSIEALKNGAKYITPDARNYPEVRPMAAEIYFCLGLAHHTKAFDDLRNSKTSDYKKHLEEAKEAYRKSWDYSQEMLESLFNLARCETLTNNEDEAIKNLITVITEDRNYHKKIDRESDFNENFKQKLNIKIKNELKKEIYPKTKATFDRIEKVRADFQTPYSTNLTELINMHLPNAFTENTSPFDILEASVYFPEILSILTKEKSEFYKKQYEEEQERELERIKRKQREEQELIERIERKRRYEENSKRELEERKRNLVCTITCIIGRVFSVFCIVFPSITIIAGNSGDPPIFRIICFIIPFLGILISDDRIIFLLVGIIFNLLLHWLGVGVEVIKPFPFMMYLSYLSSFIAGFFFWRWKPW